MVITYILGTLPLLSSGPSGQLDVWCHLSAFGSREEHFEKMAAGRSFIRISITTYHGERIAICCPKNVCS